MKPSREEVLQLAHETGCLDESHYGSVWAERLGCFASAIYSKGFAAGAEKLPEVLFDGYAVYQALSAESHLRTSPENVSDVLDAVVRLIRDLPITPTNQDGPDFEDGCSLDGFPGCCERMGCHQTNQVEGES